MPHPLAERAKRALTAKGYPRAKGMCQAFVRTNYENEYGDIFHGQNPPSADAAARLFAKTKYAVKGGSWGKVGDVFYWFGDESNPHGHAAIRILGNQVAENSTVHYGKDKDGRGTRKLEDLGRFPDLIVRFPAEK